MIHRVMVLVLLLLVVQFAQGLAIEFGPLEAGDEILMAHIGLGVLILLILLGVTYSSRREKHPAASDITFTFSIYLVQGVLGLASRMGGETGGLLATIHLYLSVFVLMAAAASLVLVFSERK
ncbi:MAG TPA: hypothetical protein EYH45_02765 [Candidatus Caldiarchaeum subterraneum]|uniref:Cytochrome oxidase assembly protein n=1 Tax=Caldiarchaeum subterraneum TaxID=311458 RepID=A0A832ZV21_CALS0|nr:hypothetical protein [Aigarchaeota archaeon]HIQ29468.1 hypothetical protein [Candidatus Caldarchaeum subterraneum]